MISNTLRGRGRTSRMVASMLLTGGAFWALPLHAQVAAAADTAAAQTGEQADAQATETGQSDVVVVARRRDEHVQSVPIPVTVITPQELARQNLVNFTNFQTKFPSFSVYLTNPKQLNLGVRGIGNNGFNTDGIDASVGVFVDGVYNARLGMVSNDFNDIADVELLRGPQGTLFGKNTTAGAVLINTLKPSYQFGAATEFTIGNQGFRQIKGSVTGPLVDGKLALRISAFASGTDGYYHNIYNGGWQNARAGEGVRAQVLANPTEDWTIRLIGTHATQDFPSMGPITLGIYNPAALQARMAAGGYTLLVSSKEKREMNIDSPLNAQTRTDALSLQQDLDLHALGTITSIGAWSRWSCFTNNDNDYTQLDAIRDYGSCNRVQQWSQEVRWASTTGHPLEGLIGGFFSRQQLDVDSRIRFGSQYHLWAGNPNATLFGTNSANGLMWGKGGWATALTGAGFDSHAVFNTKTSAVFGHATWHPDDARRLAFDLGLRQTWERKRMRYDGVIANRGGLNTDQLLALSPSGANAQLGSAADAITDTSLSGEVGVNFKPVPTVMFYVTAARGYKSKGFNLLPYNATNPDKGIATAIALGAGQHINGEQADNIEAGIKTEWFDRRLIFNLTAFHTYVKNYQANQSIGVGNTATKFLANVGALVSEGVEGEGEAFMGPLHLKGFLAYNRAVYASFANSVCPAQSSATTCDLTGRQVAWAPKWTANLTADYTHRVSDRTAVYGLVDVNWRTRQNTTITLDPAAEIPGYALTSARVGLLLDDKRLDVQLWVENLLDKAYYVNLLGVTKSTGILQGYPGAPRTFGVTIRGRL